jgi:hypothetical protein
VFTVFTHLFQSPQEDVRNMRVVVCVCWKTNEVENKKKKTEVAHPNNDLFPKPLKCHPVPPPCGTSSLRRCRTEV